jgi:dihydrofolate synthase / folylpolyglutamate synthase
MLNRTLDGWLQHWLAQHPREIVLGLDRVRAVWQALGAPRLAPNVFTVAGTNGKGSTVAFLDAILRAGSYRVGRYTSPHLLSYNERVAIDNVEVEDALLIEVFARIDAARAGVPITYFEAGTLAALLIFAEAELDAVVLEVGLGGRLDAVNLIDADVALITSIGLDHQEFLGDSLDAISVEKAGICRAERPVVIAMPDPPGALLRVVNEKCSRPLRAMLDYAWQCIPGAQSWQFTMADRHVVLPLPALSAPVQLGNASAAIAALIQRADRLPLGDAALCAGLAQVRLVGRLQVIGERPQVVLDVAHNPQAAQALADWMDADPRPTRAVFSALADKDIAGIVRVLHARITHWHLCGLSEHTPRGLSAGQVQELIAREIPESAFSVHSTPKDALVAAREASTSDERVLVFGSFYMIAAVL